VRHYERVLELAENKTPDVSEPDEVIHTPNLYFIQDGGFAQEAAYNLSLIYVMTGATPMAEDIYRRWLSI